MDRATRLLAESVGKRLAANDRVYRLTEVLQAIIAEDFGDPEEAKVCMVNLARSALSELEGWDRG